MASVIACKQSTELLPLGKDENQLCCVLGGKVPAPTALCQPVVRAHCCLAAALFSVAVTPAEPARQAFLDTMKRRGVSFLEMLAMEMKARGPRLRMP